MNVSIIDRYAKTASAQSHARDAASDESLDDLGPFSILRGVRDRALMLELRLKNGASIAFSYAYLVKAHFDPSEGISLQFGGALVKIVGRNLDAELWTNIRLFQAILMHRVAWIVEADHAASLASADDALVIDQISIA